MIIIPNYTLIHYSLQPREWGIECQFAVKPDDGRSDINDICMVSSVDATDEEIQTAIIARLQQIDPPVPPLEAP